MITADQFSELFPRAEDVDAWVDALNTVLPQHDIVDGPRLWMFLAQTGVESAGYTVFEENLFYSASGLMKVFPKYFNASTAAACAKKPEKIANIVYANRMGNGDADSGDGYAYRGRGPIQITGLRNYTNMSNALWGDTRAIDNPDLLLDPADGIASACWYWETAKVNQAADNEDVNLATRKINGGLNGLAQREDLYNKAKELLS